MNNNFIHSFQSEWLKKKRSLASWIVIIGGFFTPVIIIIARLAQHDKLTQIYTDDNFWKSLWKNSWESMAIFLLPLGVILSTSLITQIEYKNNTWKLLHTLPLKLTTIFFAKLSVILFMMLQFFIFFNIGIYLSALIPYLLVSGVAYPKNSIPFNFFLKENLLYFIDCLPIVALQYLLSLKFKNFLVSVSVGFVLWVGALASLSWKLGFIVPYTYCAFNYLKDSIGRKVTAPTINIHYFAISYFVIFTVISYIFYITKKEKG
jgi:lantibiotic transport system permease protein